MTQRTLARILAPSLLAAVAAAAPLPTAAHEGKHFKGDLESYQEVPALSSAAGGTFDAKLNAAGDAIEYELQYEDLESDVTQAHIHFGQKSVNGGIVVFLCSNLGNGPAGTQACPLRSGVVTGTIVAANVIGPTGQGIAAGQFEEFVEALRAGIAYANVHTTGFPGGEIRGQLK
jgi:hypothetical protein